MSTAYQQILSDTWKRHKQRVIEAALRAGYAIAVRDMAYRVAEMQDEPPHFHYGDPSDDPWERYQRLGGDPLGNAGQMPPETTAEEIEAAVEELKARAQ